MNGGPDVLMVPEASGSDGGEVSEDGDSSSGPPPKRPNARRLADYQRRAELSRWLQVLTHTSLVHCAWVNILFFFRRRGGMVAGTNPYLSGTLCVGKNSFSFRGQGRDGDPDIVRGLVRQRLREGKVLGDVYSDVGACLRLPTALRLADYQRRTELGRWLQFNRPS
jgi:hypothetical protein